MLRAGEVDIIGTISPALAKLAEDSSFKVTKRRWAEYAIYC